MQGLIELLALPFIQRALFAGLILAILSGILGVMTIIRRASFYGDAVAHSSLAGVSIGLALGIYPLFTALIYSILIALLLPTLKKKWHLSLDNLLGIVLPISMSFGVLIFSLLPGYQPEMMSFLFGNLLTIQVQEIYLLLFVFIFAVVVFIKFLPKLLITSIDEEYASILGLKVRRLQRLYEVLLAVVIVSGVKLVGVVLINALLIIPASAGKSIASSLKSWLVITPIISLVVVLGGIIISMIIDTPPGATIALFSGLVFIFIQMFIKIRS